VGQKDKQESHFLSLDFSVSFPASLRLCVKAGLILAAALPRWALCISALVLHSLRANWVIAVQRSAHPSQQAILGFRVSAFFRPSGFGFIKPLIRSVLAARVPIFMQESGAGCVTL
jgi:hypothetical protein